LYLVDYDLSVVPASKRVTFYRHFRKLRESYGIFTFPKSTYSVFPTLDRNLADEVYELARRFGADCHLYSATCMHPP